MQKRKQPIRPINKSSGRGGIGSSNAKSECQEHADSKFPGIANAGPSWLLAGFPFVGVRFPPIARAKAASQFALFRFPPVPLVSRNATPVLAFTSAPPPKNNGEFAGIAVGKILCSFRFSQKCSHEMAQYPYNTT